MPVNGIFKNAGVNNVGTTWVSVYTAPVGIDSIVIELDLCNILGTGIQASIRVVKSGGSPVYNLLSNAPIPAGSTLQGVSGQKIVLEAEDSIEVKSNTLLSMDVVASLIEDVNS